MVPPFRSFSNDSGRFRPWTPKSANVGGRLDQSPWTSGPIWQYLEKHTFIELGERVSCSVEMLYLEYRKAPPVDRAFCRNPKSSSRLLSLERPFDTWEALNTVRPCLARVELPGRQFQRGLVGPARTLPRATPGFGAESPGRAGVAERTVERGGAPSCSARGRGLGGRCGNGPTPGVGSKTSLLRR